MNASPQLIKNIIHGQHRYIIPVFQRYYVWDEENWELLWDTIREAYAEKANDKQPPRKRFLGSIVSASASYQPGLTSSLVVIDGQQRLTTLSLLLCAIRDRARPQDETKQLAEQINDECLLLKYGKTEDMRYRLYPRQRDRDVYISLIDGKPCEDSARNSLLHGAYQYHLKQLDNPENYPAGTDNLAYLQRVFEAVLTQLEVVSITLEEGDNPFQIFRSLNSTGADLEEGDLIRNHVFMQLHPNEQDKFDDKHWQKLEAVFQISPDNRRVASNDPRVSEADKAKAKASAILLTDFFRDELMTFGRYVKTKETYTEFQSDFKKRTEKKADTIEVLLARLTDEWTEQAKLYQAIRGEAPAPTERSAYALGLIRELQMVSAYPLVLKCLSLHRERGITEEVLVANLRAISGFFLRRSVCGMSSRSYSKWFCQWSGELNSQNAAELPVWLGKQDWPSDEKFIETFVMFEMYNSKYGRTIITRIERESQHPHEPVELDQCQVEHVLPQTIDPLTEDGKEWVVALGGEWERVRETWRNRPGNLTLVGAGYNPVMSNKSYQRKLPILADKSKFALNGYFKDIAAWDEEAIKERGRVLGGLAAKIWVGPQDASAKPNVGRGKRK